MVLCIHVHATDAPARQFFRQSVADLLTAGSIHHIQAIVGTDVVGVLPEDDGIHHTALHADGSVYVLKRGLGHP